MAQPVDIVRRGIHELSRRTMKVGDVVAVEGSLAKDGSKHGNARVVIMASTGKRLFAASSQGQTP